MIYRAKLLFKHAGTYVRPNTLVELEDEDEIKMLKGAKAIADVEMKVETAMAAPAPEVRDEGPTAIGQPKPKQVGRRRQKTGRRR